MANTSGLWEHPDWSRQKAPQDEEDEGPGLEYIDLDSINDWVVKFTFDQMIKNKIASFTGNGFFLYVPDMEDTYVILTAAHNLMLEGKRTFNVKVLYNNPYELDPDNPGKVKFCDDKKPPIIEHPVDNTEDNRDVYICKAYQKGVPTADYAVIRIPRKPNDPPRGFWFSIKLAYKKSFNGNVHVSGFKGDMMKSLRPLTSSSPNMKYHENYVEYRAKTEKGISGSPVWVGYKGYPTVIAVHNNSPIDITNPTNGSRGALITADFLFDVFDWLDPKLLKKNVQVQVRTEDLRKKKLPAADHGLFLSFMTNTGFGRVRLGSGTKFNWIPAQVNPTGVLYALSVVGEKKWLRFNTAAVQYKGVDLSDTVDARGCLFLDFPKKMNFGVRTGVGEKKVDWQLRMECTGIKVYDIRRESSEVSIVKSGSPESNFDFKKFILKAD